jgi:hypothetical protein
MKKIQWMLVLAMLVIGFAGCKYDEGPFISFIPKTERVGNTWVVNTAVINGTPQASINGFKKITFFKEGACQIIWIDGTTEKSSLGTWEFTEKKEAIHIEVAEELNATKTYVNDWTILHLKEKQLKVTYINTNSTGGKDTYIVTFEPAV